MQLLTLPNKRVAKFNPEYSKMKVETLFKQIFKK